MVVKKWARKLGQGTIKQDMKSSEIFIPILISLFLIGYQKSYLHLNLFFCNYRNALINYCPGAYLILTYLYGRLFKGVLIKYPMGKNLFTFILNNDEVISISML